MQTHLECGWSRRRAAAAGQRVPRPAPWRSSLCPAGSLQARSAEREVSGCQAGSVGLPWLALGLAPWGSPGGPRLLEGRATVFTLERASGIK